MSVLWDFIHDYFVNSGEKMAPYCFAVIFTNNIWKDVLSAKLVITWEEKEIAKHKDKGKMFY